MAISERWLREKFGAENISHNVFVICGDGDLSEGVSHEAASLAGSQQLGNLICIYDDNHITIDGPTELSLADDAAKRFEAYGWNVIDLGESGEDLDVIENALLEGKSNTTSPTIIILRTHIGHPSPTLTDSPVPMDMRLKIRKLLRLKNLWVYLQRNLFSYLLRYWICIGRLANDINMKQRVTPGAPKIMWVLGTCPLSKIGMKKSVGENVATRVASGVCLEEIAKDFSVIAGGADLTGNTGTALKNCEQLSPSTPSGKQLYYGVREHAMGAVMNGIALHGCVVPVGGTFLVFSDYMRPAIRLAALSKAKVIYSFTHDSVGVGEDGPTHQPIEQIMSLRSIPNLLVIRPADAKETVAAWINALNHDGPTALILSRQNLPILAETNVEQAQKGAYFLKEDSEANTTLIATGSEVSLCMEYASNETVNVLSIPSWELAEQFVPVIQMWDEYSVDKKVISVEAGVTLGWSRYADTSIGIDRFGASAPGNQVMDALGVNTGNINKEVKEGRN